MTKPLIESYRFGHIEIDGTTYTKDVILLPDRVIDHWWRRQGHSLHPDDLTAVLDAEPEILVVGRGAYGRMRVPDQTREAIEARGIKLIVEKSSSAVETYNRLREERDAAAALHLTC